MLVNFERNMVYLAEDKKISDIFMYSYIACQHKIRHPLQGVLCHRLFKNMENMKKARPLRRILISEHLLLNVSVIVSKSTRLHVYRVPNTVPFKLG